MIYRLIIISLLFSFSVCVQAKTILILGDSISAAYGIPVEKGWVNLLDQRLKRHGYDYDVVNASITGETTLGAKFRLNDLLEQYQPELVVIELGGNDGLQGFTLEEIENNFIELVRMTKQMDSDTLLVPMQMPPNYGSTYRNGFNSIYERVSEKMDVTRSTFLFHGFADDPELMQADFIHPVEEAQSIMLDNIWPSLETLIIK